MASYLTSVLVKIIFKQIQRTTLTCSIFSELGQQIRSADCETKTNQIYSWCTWPSYKRIKLWTLTLVKCCQIQPLIVQILLCTGLGRLIKMSLFHGRARQPEIIRTIQKDLKFTNELASEFSDILRLSGSSTWIRYNHLCKLLAEIAYHGFASLNNLQTLGEEYTGIIQVDSKFISLPSKLLQLASIILEFGGDTLYLKILKKFENEIAQNNDILPEAKVKLTKLAAFMRAVTPYIKGFHKSLFYLGSTKYQLSKRFTGINYVLIRHWIQPGYSLYGYKILGVITLLQLLLSSTYHVYEAVSKDKAKQEIISRKTFNRERSISSKKRDAPPCSLCLEPRENTSLTTCGHLFCWDCIIDWLDEREECPICREKLKKSNVVQLQNYI